MNDNRESQEWNEIRRRVVANAFCYEYSSIYAINGKRFITFAPCIHRVAFGHANRAVSHGGTMMGCEL